MNNEGVISENWSNKDSVVSREGNPPESRADSFFRELKRPSSPNTYLIAPMGFPADPNELAPTFSVSAEQLRTAFEETVNGLPGVSEERHVGTIRHYVAQTSIFRFKDDIHVQFIDLGGGRSTLAAYSASRVGYWDLGKNRRRLRAWLALVQDRLETQ